MRFTHLLVVAPLWMAVASNAFSLIPHKQCHRAFALSASDSDFATAMPNKPEMTMQERVTKGATEFIAKFRDDLGDGVDLPPEFDALVEARDSGASTSVLASRVYELMIEQGMSYDTDPETGAMAPTAWDIKENLETSEVKSEFAYLYNYGMGLIQNGLVEVDEVKSIVKERLIERTGKTPEEFDEWLGY